MVRLGMAYAYRQYLSGCDENAFLGAEAQAELGRQGVWRWGNEIKPWYFRKTKSVQVTHALPRIGYKKAGVKQLLISRRVRCIAIRLIKFLSESVLKNQETY